MAATGRNRPAQLGSLHQRRAALVVVIFDLAIRGTGSILPLMILRSFRFARNRHGPFAQMAGTTAFGTALEQIDEVEPIEEGEHTTERAQEAA